jgi:hypothetical protein
MVPKKYNPRSSRRTGVSPVYLYLKIVSKYCKDYSSGLSASSKKNYIVYREFSRARILYKFSYYLYSLFLGYLDSKSIYRFTNLPVKDKIQDKYFTPTLILPPQGGGKER